jgi:hypothetical protein
VENLSIGLANRCMAWREVRYSHWSDFGPIAFSERGESPHRRARDRQSPQAPAERSTGWSADSVRFRSDGNSPDGREQKDLAHAWRVVR